MFCRRNTCLFLRSNGTGFVNRSDESNPNASNYCLSWNGCFFRWQHFKTDAFCFVFETDAFFRRQRNRCPREKLAYFLISDWIASQLRPPMIENIVLFLLNAGAGD